MTDASQLDIWFSAVSVLALIGLTAGRELGWVWMDPVMGIVGMLVIANWSWNLVRISGAVLLDMRPEDGVAAEIAQRLEAGSDDRISDLHLWRVGPGHSAAVVSLVSDRSARHLQGAARQHRGLEPRHHRGPDLPGKTFEVKGGHSVLTTWYPERPDLQRYVKPLGLGWSIGANIANREKAKILREACKLAGLTFGRDVQIRWGAVGGPDA